MICIFHDWVFSKLKNSKRENASVSWYSKRVCSKCGKIQINNPTLRWQQWDTGYPINECKLIENWKTVGYDDNN